jgi:hypothetical protein
VALVVHGEQAFLDEVFHFIGPAEQALAQKGAQVRAELLQEVAVGLRVAVEARRNRPRSAASASLICILLPTVVRAIGLAGYSLFEK